jgi:hypothetical protein
MYDEGRSVTEIDLWGPETITAMPGAAAWVRGDDAYNDISELMIESGMHWDYGPFRAAVIATTYEMEEWEEHGTAYEQWCHGEANMDDLHEKSLFTEWNQATGKSEFIGADQLSKNMKVPQFTPEMLAQRDDLNRMFNLKWNEPQTWLPGTPWTPMYVPDQTELLEITATGDNHGVAKCAFGAVFVPKGVLKHLEWNGGHSVGTLLDAEITFTPGNKFPWRVKKNGVTFTYQDMQGTRQDDY